ncbi:hypothetical protein [Maribacter flavus]|uniref:Uncharacterized protein n=1 Tax=Maribacter flavus TaxID=1658664 RepID=A0A5B2TXR2_9FLAO|nr:hypothetical protein [Maribacter flavus]KAA2218953.1 hypothetical protein F0361_04870 [Maribacter flavus]
MQSETAWAMRAKDLLDFKYPKISLAFLDTFSAMEKVSVRNFDPPRSAVAEHPSLTREGSFFKEAPPLVRNSTSVGCLGTNIIYR